MIIFSSRCESRCGGVRDSRTIEGGRVGSDHDIYPQWNN